jgi:hypothetical protein
MKKCYKACAMGLVASSFVIPGLTVAENKPCTIVVGASLANSNWPIVTDPQGRETMDSRNALLRGNYVGLCQALQEAVGIERKVSCPAVAGAMSTDFIFPFINDTQINAAGYLSQFGQGVRECTWNGTLLATSLVITITNDGPFAVDPTKQLIDRALELGIKNIIVQAYPAHMPDFQREKDTALEKHGQYWGSLIQAFLAHVPTESEYQALAAFHESEMRFYTGVKTYFDFYSQGQYKSFDGTHPAPETQHHAAQLVKEALE